MTDAACRIARSARSSSAHTATTKSPVDSASGASAAVGSTPKESAETINAHIADNFLGERPGREELLRTLGTRDRYKTPPRDDGPQADEGPEADAPELLGVTPLRCSLDGFMNPDRTLDSVRAYVIQDLADAAPTTIEDWLDLYLGVAPSTYRRWRAEIAEAHWFEDKSIRDALDEYSACTGEEDRYDPFITLLSRIIEMGRELIYPAEGTGFPINDLQLVDHSSKYIHRTVEHGNMAAERKPDVILKRKSSQMERGRAKWTDILTWFELKCNGALTELLTSARADRALFPTPVAPSVQTSSSAGVAEQVRFITHY